MLAIALTALARHNATRASARSGGWSVSDSLPTLVLPPKCAISSVISFLNNCTSGLVNPKQTLCLTATCSRRSGTVVTDDGDIIHLHVVPSHGERLYGLIRHPVTRFISFVRYRLSQGLSGMHARRDFVQAGLSIHNTNISHLLDSA